MTGGPHVVLGTAGLRADEVLAVARGGRPVRLAPEALAEMARTRAQVDALAASPTPVYGVSTGFGALATRHIGPPLRAQLQRSLIRSHAAGMGAPVATEVVRALMLLRARTLATGRTGVRPAVAEAVVALLNHGVTPVVPTYGSLGCSGDLAPLAHCALALMGEGQARAADGALLEGPRAMAAAGQEPLVLAAKEGLALINGTDGMLGMLLLACEDLSVLLHRGRRHRVDERGSPARHGPGLRGGAARPLRPHPGQILSARNMRRLLAGSADRRLPPLAGHQGPGRLFAAVRPAGQRGRSATPWPTPSWSRRASWRR